MFIGTYQCAEFCVFIMILLLKNSSRFENNFVGLSK